MYLRLKQRVLDLTEPKVMGILNVTPDSFSDGGRFTALDAAIRQAEAMMMEGAVIIDIGGESTRPGAVAVSAQEELERVIPVVEKVSTHLDVAVSIDTSKPEVMREAVMAGASMINDVCALCNSGAMETAVRLQVPVCLMHMQGEPRTMQIQPNYNNVVEDVKQFLFQRARVCQDSGLSADQIVLDPGFGFGKALQHNLTLLRQLHDFTVMGYPLLVGLSRKSMLGKILGAVEAKPAQARLYAGIAATLMAVERGAKLIRTHDVGATQDALAVYAAVNRDEHAGVQKHE